MTVIVISNNFERWTNIDSSNPYNKSYKIGGGESIELLVMCLSRDMPGGLQSMGSRRVGHD